MRRINLVVLALVLLAQILFVGCTRGSQEAASSSKVPAALVKAAGGKAAFIEFYAPN